MAKRLVLSFIATDEPGQVERITEAVAKSGGNWLDSRMAHLAEKFAGVARVSVPDDKAAALEAAPMSGGRLFHAKGRVRMPAGLDEGQLRGSLESLAEALMVDITLEEETA